MSDDAIMRTVSADLPQKRALPLLLVDIDGVVSLWGWADSQRPRGRWTLVDGIGHFLSLEAAGRLRELQDAYELVWCSGWEDRANDHLPLLVGLGPLPHLAFDPSSDDAEPRAHWKLAAIDAYAGPDRALAWVDDAFNAGCHAWAAERAGPTLLVETRPAEGFTLAQAEQLRAWALPAG